jgi:Asp-tRNA(Asn)/Glu-tRNA(Gln) amidotransferase A subunit family amidase
MRQSVPSARGEAPNGLASTGDSVFNSDWTTLHTPAVTVPVFRGPAGLPMGAQFVGAYGADYRTLACAAWALRALSQLPPPYPPPHTAREGSYC